MQKRDFDKEYREWLFSVWAFFVCGGAIGIIIGYLSWAI